MYLKHLAIYVTLFILLIPDTAIGLTKEQQKKYIADFKTSFSNGVSNYKQKKYEQAVTYWNDALEFIRLAELQETPQIIKIKETLFLNKGEAYRNLSMRENLDENKYFDKAQKNYDKMKLFLPANTDTVNLSLYSLYSDRARRYRAIGKHINAIDYQDKAIKYAINISKKYPKKKQIMANANRSLAISQKYLGKYDEALESFQKSADYWKKGENEREFLKDKMNIAFVNMDTGLLIDASDQLNDIINSYKEKDKEDLLFAHTNLNLGRCDYILGNYDKASYHFEKAHVIYNKLKRKQTVDESEMPQLDRGRDAANMNLGLIACEQGLYDDALLKFDQVSKKTSDEQLKTMALSNKAVVFLNYYLEDPKKLYLDNAENNLNAAKDLVEMTGDTRMNMSILQKLGKVLTERGDYANANKSFKTASDQAKKIFRKGKRPPFYEYSNILSCWADVHLKQGDPNKVENAIVNYKESIENAKNISVANEQLWYAYYGLARAYRVQRDIEKAVDNYKLSIYVIENMRDLISGSGSVGFLRNKHQVYTDLIDLLLEQWEKEKDDTKEKLRYSNMALMYLERSRLAAVKSLFEKALPGSKEMVRRKLNEIDHKMKNASDDSKLIQLKNEKASLERQLEKDDQLIQKVEMNKSTLNNIIGNMDAKQLMLEFYYNDKSIYVWKLKKASDKPELYIIKRIYFDEDEDEHVDIIQDVMCLYESISDKDILLTEIYDTEEIEIFENAIYERILSPLRIEKGKYDYITVIPYGKLWLLPFSVVGSGNQKLIDKWGINYFFSLTQQLVMAKSSGSNNLLAVGNPTMPDYISNTAISRISGIRGSSDITTGDINLDDVEFEEARNILAKVYGMKQGTMGGRQKKRIISRGQLFAQLPKAGLEVKEINDVFREIHGSSSSRFSVHDKAVNEKIVKEKVLSNDYNYIHFATHGKLVSDSPLDSFLVFSNDPDKSENNSGLLTVKEIRKDFFGALGGVRLVVLSACQTSLAFSSSESQTVNGMEFASLSGAFQSAGVSAVIASLWPVSSGATAKLMKEFYVHLLKGEPVGKALHLAQKELHNKDCTVNVTLTTDTKGEKDEEVSRKCDIEFCWAPFILLGSFN